MGRCLFGVVLFVASCTGHAPPNPQRRASSLESPPEASGKAELPLSVPRAPLAPPKNHPWEDASLRGPKSEPASEPQSLPVRGPDRDYAVRVGIGFLPEEVELLEKAVTKWRELTGLPMYLRHGYGPLGNFHLAEQIPVCGQRWVYDGFLGCYSFEDDAVVLNRPGIFLEAKEQPDLLYIVLVHELGHWLGLEHADESEESVMLPDYLHLVKRQGDLAAPSARDVERVCAINRCRRVPLGP